MAFKTLIQSGQAKLLEKKGDSITGHLVRAETGIGKYESTIYTFQTDNGPIKIWGNNQIDSALLDIDGEELREDLTGALTRITVIDVRKKGKKTYRDYQVEVDLAKRLAREDIPQYRLDSRKKMSRKKLARK